MNQAYRLAFILPLLLAACVRVTPPTTDPTPTTPTDPAPTPPDTSIPYAGEWLVTFTSTDGGTFTHALEVTANMSTDGLGNAGGGLQQSCAETCSATEASGFGFVGDLLLSDGTTVRALALFAQTSEPGSTALEAYTVQPITLTTNEAGQTTFTATAAWEDPNDGTVEGMMTATHVGEAKSLGGFGLINIDEAVEMLRQTAYY